MRKLISIAVVVLLMGTVFFFRNSWWVKRAQVRWLSSSFQALKRETGIGKLGLSDEQGRLLESNRALYRLDNAQIDGAIEVKKAELDNELENPVPDQKKLTRLCQQLGKLYGKKERNRIRYVIKVEKKILTPDQLTALENSPGLEKNPIVNVAFMN